MTISGDRKEQDIAELYQQVILDHNKNPKNFRVIEAASIVKEGFNPVCGDHLHLYIQIDAQGEVIEDISFLGEGCAISKASASMMTGSLKGKPISHALKTFEEFHALLTRKLDPEKDSHNLGKLKIFSGIWKYPSRIKCAGLSWHTLKAALEEAQGKEKSTGPVKTE